jgi:GNAT superfamily N-acetyltransferase
MTESGTATSVTTWSEDDLRVREVPRADVESLIPILILAEPSERALRWSLRNLSDTVYLMTLAGEPVGAASVRWDDEPAEIVELAIVEALHGRGLGRRLIDWIIAEAAHRTCRALDVGTRNASLGNIAFYQRCGFRMHHVRQDYFTYYPAPVYENGIEVRDLLVFRYELRQARSRFTGGSGRPGQRR